MPKNSRIAFRLFVALIACVAVWPGSSSSAQTSLPTSSGTTNVFVLSGTRLLTAVDAVGDGADGVVVLADQQYRTTYFSLGANGDLAWAFEIDKIARPKRIVRTSNGFLAMGHEPPNMKEGDIRAGFFLEIDSSGRPLRLRRLIGDDVVYVADAARVGDETALLVAAPRFAVMMLDDALASRWIFALDPSTQARFEAIASYEGGVVAAGATDGACLVSRFDEKGNAVWSNRYETGSRGGCVDVVTRNGIIYATGTAGPNVVLIALRSDGSVAHSSVMAVDGGRPSLLAGRDWITLVTEGMMERKGMPLATFFLRFSEGPVPDKVVALQKSGEQASFPPPQPWDFGMAAAGDREFFFFNVADDRVIGVSSNRESWAEDCGPFEEDEHRWIPIKTSAKPYPLPRGTMNLSFVDGTTPKAIAVSLVVEDNCMKPSPKYEKPDPMAGFKLPEVPVGTWATVPVDELEKIKPARKAWADLFRARRWADLERVVNELIAPNARFENGGWKMIDFERALTVGAEELSDLDENAYFARIEEWKKAFPKSDRPTIQTAVSMRELAWRARGRGLGSSVTEEGARSFSHYNNEVIRLLTPLIERGTKDPSAYQALVDAIGPGSGDPMPVVRRALQVVPEYHHVYEARLDYLRAGWGGSSEEVQAFLDEIVPALDPSIRDQVYARLAWYVSWSNPIAFREIRIDRDRVARGFEAIGRRFPKSTRDWYRYAGVMCAIGDQTAARRIFTDPRLAYETSLARRYFGGQVNFAIARVWSESRTPAPPIGKSWENVLFGTRAWTQSRDLIYGGFAVFVDHAGKPIGLTSPVPMLEPVPGKPNQLRVPGGLSWSVRRRGDRSQSFDMTLASPQMNVVIPQGIALAPALSSSVPREVILETRTGPVAPFEPLWIIASDDIGRPIRPLFASSDFEGDRSFDLIVMARRIELDLLLGAPVITADGKLAGIVVSIADNGGIRCESPAAIFSYLPVGKR